MIINFFICKVSYQFESRYTATLWKRLLATAKLEAVRSISWGINHESIAIQEYCALGAVVENTGRLTLVAIMQSVLLVII